ncbi:MAG: hypothetical protein ABI723_20370 [Bacteroidia bacterium]
MKISLKQKIIIILLFATGFMLNSCKKSLFTTVKVTYAVKVKAGNKVVINCNNDYYFDSKTRKPIEWTSDGSTWKTDHFVYQEEEYYLKVDYVDSTQAIEDNYKVQIFYNDTIPVASSITDHAVPSIEFSGTVKEL